MMLARKREDGSRQKLRDAGGESARWIEKSRI